MRILIVEDNQTTASYLQQGLKENLFIADLANDGQEGLFLATTQSYELIILDVMLPQINGPSVPATLRQK